MSSQPEPALAGILETSSLMVRAVRVIPERAAEFVDAGPVITQPGSSTLQRALQEVAPNGLYRHQATAINLSLAGRDAAIVTKAASGKTLAFQVSAAAQLLSDPASRILATYPMKALSNEQAISWERFLAEACPDARRPQVSTITGELPVALREEALRSARVAVMTPDVVHAWLLGQLTNSAVQDFLRNLRLVVLDEAHVYRGVFGSNAAYLWRRLDHAARALGGGFKYIAASATMHEPEAHLYQLTGRRFAIVPVESDTSPQHEIRVFLVQGSEATKVDGFGTFLKRAAAVEGQRFLAFVESRRQAELTAASVIRRDSETEREFGPEGVDDRDLKGRGVVPYRSGYEREDRRRIEAALRDGVIKGVVSTSALELGIDLPHLTTVILYGMPSSSTSLYQRIGRVGRHRPGEVYLLDSGSPQDQLVFEDPDQFFNRPLLRSAIHLQNQFVQYIHTLCFGQRDQEHDSLAPAVKEETSITSEVEWPGRFLELCQRERAGTIPGALQALKATAGDSPRYSFPLRDVTGQYQVYWNHGPNRQALGSLSEDQLLREAYPGGLYFYMGQPHRVLKVWRPRRTVEVRRTGGFRTDPQVGPPVILPNLAHDTVLAYHRADGLRVLEVHLQVRRSIFGVTEIRGKERLHFRYPLVGQPDGVSYELPTFTSNLFTTGVLLYSADWDWPAAVWQPLSEMLREAFLLEIPYDSNDIGAGADYFRVSESRVDARSEQRFLSLYDQTYGSLRLTSEAIPILARLEPHLFRLVEKDSRFAGKAEGLEDAVVELVDALKGQLESPPRELDLTARSGAEGTHRVIAVGSRGILRTEGDREVIIRKVYFTPKGPMYESTYAEANPDSKDFTIRCPVDQVSPVFGISHLATFDPMTDSLTSDSESGSGGSPPDLPQTEQPLGQG